MYKPLTALHLSSLTESTKFIMSSYLLQCAPLLSNLWEADPSLTSCLEAQFLSIKPSEWGMANDYSGLPKNWKNWSRERDGCVTF